MFNTIEVAKQQSEEKDDVQVLLRVVTTAMSRISTLLLKYCITLKER